MVYVLLGICALVCIRVSLDGFQMECFKEKDTVVAEYKYKCKAEVETEKEKYEKAQQNTEPSGFMTKEEYENISRGRDRYFIEVGEAEVPKDSEMKYVPQPTYKFTRYNNPPGNHELSLPRSLNFDRQVNVQGIISSDFEKLVYPSVHYYANHHCTTCDLYYLPLDKTLNDMERVLKANVIHRDEKPLISSEKDITTPYVFRTLTPVDFSEDNTKLIVKEKTGYTYDGIWQTDLWVYDFNANKAKKIVEIRDAIINYWQLVGGVDFENRRWDIYPLGFDANDQNRVIVSAYAYTGDVPKFLGTWSIDVDGERAELKSLRGTNVPISMVGFKLVKDSIVPEDEVQFEAKRTKKVEKNREKTRKKTLKQIKKERKEQYKIKVKQIKADYKLRIKEYKDKKKLNKKKYTKATS